MKQAIKKDMYDKSIKKADIKLLANVMARIVVHFRKDDILLKEEWIKILEKSLAQDTLVRSKMGGKK